MAVLGIANAGAATPRNVYFQLAGIKAVSLFTDLGEIPGMDSELVVRQISEHLLAGKLQVLAVSKEGPVLALRVTRNYLKAACPDLLSVQVSISLSEPIVLPRNRKLKNVVGETWRNDGFVSIMSEAEAPDFVRREVVSLVDGFASDVAYATDVSSGR